MNKHIALFIGIVISLFCFTSCSETDEESDEYENWQERNDKYFDEVYQTATNQISSGSSNWKVFTAWSKDTVTSIQDQIVVEVLNEGTGTESPLYTDSVRVHMEGRLIPSASYAEGYVFSSSWTGDYNTSTMIPVSYTVSSLVDGFTTALLHMHVGDRWRVYIPYSLGYGEEGSSSSIPGYSTLIFDITLHSFVRKGTAMPSFQ